MNKQPAHSYWQTLCSHVSAPDLLCSMTNAFARAWGKTSKTPFQKLVSFFTNSRPPRSAFSWTKKLPGHAGWAGVPRSGYKHFWNSTWGCVCGGDETTLRFSCRLRKILSTAYRLASLNTCTQPIPYRKQSKAGGSWKKPNHPRGWVICLARFSVQKISRCPSVLLRDR